MGRVQGDDAQTGSSNTFSPKSCWHDPLHSPTRGWREDVQDDMDAEDARGDEGLKSRQSKRGGAEVDTSPVPGRA